MSGKRRRASRGSARG